MPDQADPTVNIAVSGDFKHLQLIPELNKAAKLGRVLYASRLSNNAKRLQLSSAQARNLFLKAYLLHFHARYLNHAFGDVIYPLYDKIWTTSAQLAWQPCDVLHVVMQGNSLSLIQRAKREGSAILGHPVVSHPSFFKRELLLETDRLKIDPTPLLSDATDPIEEIKLCDRIYCLSTLVRDSFVAAGFSSDNIDVIPLPIDLRAFAPAAARPSDAPFRLLCVAGLHPIKGHIYLLEALKKLKLPNSELLLVGTMRQEMKEMLKQYEGLYKYVGPLGRDDLVRLYQDSSLLVLPSVQDGFGFVVAEALACGLPAIVTDRVGARDIIRDGENGFVVPHRSPDALAETIARIHASHSLQQALREGAIASRQTFPTIGETIQRLAAAYRKTYAVQRDQVRA